MCKVSQNLNLFYIECYDFIFNNKEENIKPLILIKKQQIEKYDRIIDIQNEKVTIQNSKPTDIQFFKKAAIKKWN